MIQSKVREYGACPWCHKPIEAIAVPLRLQVAGRQLELDSVPQGVCRTCGDKYYKAEILELLETVLRGEQREERKQH